ncbi:MAG: hypothetical protein CMM42_10710 [Rhodospirillaceae bacterium]|nr:hypothetical protein [Rhodospirillaceae bacterium]
MARFLMEFMMTKPRCLLIANFAPLSSIWDMGRGMRTALENADVSVMEYLRSDFPNEGLNRIMVKMIAEFKGPRFVLDINANENYRVPNGSLYDAYRLPRMSFITDSPLRHMAKIQAMPENSILGLVDGDFPDILADFPCPSHCHIPFPHAGPPPEPAPLSNDQRDIPVLFVGNITSAPSQDDFLTRHGGSDRGLRKALSQAVEAARETDAALYALCKAALPGKSPQDWLAATNDLESHLISTRRIALLNSLKQRKIVYCGVIDPSLRTALPGTMEDRGAVTFEDAADLMGRARVLINSSPSFRNGAHERVFYGLSRGASVVTEPSRFLTPAQATALGITPLPFAADRAATAIDQAMARTDDDRHTAQAHYARTHTWTQRMETVLTCLKDQFWTTP